MADDIKTIIEETAKKTGEEVKCHFDVVAESLHSDIKAVAEGVETNTQQLERIEARLDKLEPIKDDVEAIKVTVGSIQNDLKRKADREELVALEMKLRPA